MGKFIEVTDSRYHDELVINTDSIAWINPASGTVCFSGVHAEHDGLRSFDEENIKKILEAVKED